MVNLNITFESTGIENEPSKALFGTVIDNVESLTELRMMGSQCTETTSAHFLMEISRARKDPAHGKITFSVNVLGGILFSSTIWSKQMGFVFHIILRNVVCFCYIPPSSQKKTYKEFQPSNQALC